MDKLLKLQSQLIDFRDARDWRQFHTPKDLALSLSLEASEVLELFQWRTNEECQEYIRTHKEDLADEMSDVLNYLLIMAHDFNINLCEAAAKKIAKNAQKYPVDQAKGNHKKYTELKNEYYQAL